MLWTILMVILVLWLLGLIGGVGGSFDVHLLLVVAAIVFDSSAYHRPQGRGVAGN
jgi:hypothetical protein